MLKQHKTESSWAIKGDNSSPIHPLRFAGVCRWLGLVLSTAFAILRFVLVTLPDYFRSFIELQLASFNPGSNLPPGSLGLPLFGEMFQFIQQAATSEFFQRRISLYGLIFKTNILFKPTIFVAGADALQKVLCGEDDIVENCWPAPMRRLLGPGALATNLGQVHKDRRKVILRSFQNSFFVASLPLLREVIDAELDRWVALESRVEVYGSAKRMAIRAAAMVLLGVKADDLDDVNRYILDYGSGFFAFPLNLPGTTYYKALRAKTELHEILKSSLRTKENAEEAGADGNVQRFDLISQILAHNSKEGSSGEPIDHVIDQALELLYGGQETISGFVTCLVMLLASKPDVIEKLKQELEENDFLSEEEGKESENRLDLTSLSKLKYVDYVVKEVLRLYPPIGGGYRKVVKDFHVKEFQVPKNWAVTYSIKATHDSSPFFSEDKDIFRPERWSSLLDHPSSLRLRYHFLPFGAGDRACVGQRYAIIFMRLFTALLIRRVSSWQLETSNPVMLAVPIVRPQSGLFVRFHQRTMRDSKVE